MDPQVQVWAASALAALVACLRLRVSGPCCGETLQESDERQDEKD